MIEMPTDLESPEQSRTDFFASTSVNRAGFEITIATYLISAIHIYGPDASRALVRWYEQGGANALVEYFRTAGF